MKLPSARTSPDKSGRAEESRAEAANQRRLVEVCTAPADRVPEMLAGTPNGLSSEDAGRRLGEFGPNELVRRTRHRFLRNLAQRFANPLVIQLLVIAGISAAIGEAKSAVIVGTMILLSIGLSWILDSRSDRAVEDLGARVQSRTTVLRDGKETDIRISEVVPGDVVVLRSGSIVPADIRLLAAKDFFVGESALTGESMPVEKTAAAPGAAPASALDLANACFFGTSVNSGAARGIVVNTGVRTLFGSISRRLSDRREQTGFDMGIKSFTWLMIRFMLVMVSAVFLLVGATKGNWAEALLFGLSVAVGLTPEMLPMIVTVNLAKGALTMARKKVIVKHLPAIQNFGAIDILCTDKTGTLTQDRVVLEHHVDITGHANDDVLTYAWLNSYFQTGLKNLIDRAVIDHVDMEPGPEVRLVDELPFDFQRRRMSVAVAYEGDHVLICKGAVEEIYDCCSHYQMEDMVYPLIEMIRTDLFEEVERLNREGFRVLGIAYREFPTGKASFTVADESGMTLLGYIAFFDPPKGTAREALGLLRDSGVRVKVLTGDNQLVTEKVCRDVGLEVERTVTGSELAGLGPAGFRECIGGNDVFVKLSPSQKEQIVRELRAGGHIVGFMGDGINDAPALKAADVGISVDSAVDVAKESADIVLLEKSLNILEEGIVEGRKVFANIIKYIRMGASSNFGNMFSVLGASCLLPFLPMKPVQILANNLLYDFSQTGIPSDRVDPDLVAKPLKWDIANIKRFMFVIGPMSSIFDYATFALMWFFFGCAAFLDPASGPAGKEALSSLFQTGWFVESLLTQTLIVHIIRTKRVPFFGSRASGQMMLTTLAVMATGVWLPYSPFAAALGLVPLPPIFWAWMAGFLLAYSVLTHNVKRWFFRKFGGG